MIRHKKWDIDKYNIIKHIGKGSFSNVYLCKNELDLLCEDIYNNDEYFIIKEININVLVDKYMSNSKSEYRFNKMQHKKGNSDVSVNITPYTKNNAIMISSKSTERDYYYYKLKGLIESEIEILNLLNHSSIIKFNNYMEYDNVYYLNLEYCDKGDVYYMLKNENYEITNEYIYEFLNQTANGLAYMHNNNIIHRDIKLQNILVKTDERLNNKKFKYVFKLSDFGFSCYDMSIVKFPEEEYLDDMLCKKYYKLCGTPYFMAPEIILNMNKLENFTFYDEKRKINLSEFYDKRIDIWSYGICIY
jgi:serine/threonine protein kinase